MKYIVKHTNVFSENNLYSPGMAKALGKVVTSMYSNILVKTIHITYSTFSDLLSCILSTYVRLQSH